MRLSEYYELERTQASLDFVDIDTTDDLTVFIDPRPIRTMPSEWAKTAQMLLQTFFSTLLQAIRTSDNDLLERLLSGLSEPYEIHFGYGRGTYRGRGVGRGIGAKLRAALEQSEAVRTGLLEDLEDTVLLVPGVNRDLISDITANVIRGPLIRYTQRMAELYEIPTEETYSGHIWVPETNSWEDGYTDLPIPGDRVILVPKYIARYELDYNDSDYYRLYLAPILEGIEIDAGSNLVRTLKDGRTRVNMKDLIKKYGKDRETIFQLTREHPEALERYRNSMVRRTKPPLDHADLAAQMGTGLPDFHALLAAAMAIAAGEAGANAYHRAVQDLLAAVFYPALIDIEREKPLNMGRKRVDLVLTNVARSGFFEYVSRHFTAPYVFIEVKNYSEDPGNPEFDQIAMRFSRERGRFGLLVCRRFKDKKLALQRCRDIAAAGNGIVLPVDDDTLKELADLAAASGGVATETLLAFPPLKQLLDAVIL